MTCISNLQLKTIHRCPGGEVKVDWSHHFANVSKVDSPNFRILASKFCFPSSSLLVVNVYFPCDPQVDQFDEKELITLLLDLQIHFFFIRMKFIRRIG